MLWLPRLFSSILVSALLAWPGANAVARQAVAASGLDRVEQLAAAEFAKTPAAA